MYYEAMAARKNKSIKNYEKELIKDKKFKINKLINLSNK